MTTKEVLEDIIKELTDWRALKEKRMGNKWEGLQSLDDAIYVVKKAIDKELA